ncbi:MAG TPA: DUF1697 domain-containing protein [Acidimicrobiales bacterium]|nr:DUF1697 domain-containing protein [Acidimicrobiales bacterium]
MVVQKGSHVQLKHPDRGGRVTVPMHAGETIGPGLSKLFVDVGGKQMRYLALLRAVNAGPGTRVSMPALCAGFAAAGLPVLATYRQSGNVILDLPRIDTAHIAERVEDAVSDLLHHPPPRSCSPVSLWPASWPPPPPPGPATAATSIASSCPPAT